MQRRTAQLFLFLGAATLSAGLPAASDHVQRQLQQREQAQTELRLKMQQQQDRAAQPAESPSADLQRRVLERDQQQRLKALQERQSRSAAVPDDGNAIQRDLERQRAAQAASEQLKRFELERQLETRRNREEE